MPVFPRSPNRGAVVQPQQPSPARVGGQGIVPKSETRSTIPSVRSLQAHNGQLIFTEAQARWTASTAGKRKPPPLGMRPWRTRYTSLVVRPHGLEPVGAGGDDGVGFGAPDEGFGVFVVPLDEAVDGGLEVDDGADHAVFQAAPAERGDEALDRVAPSIVSKTIDPAANAAGVRMRPRKALGRRDVEAPARMPRQPSRHVGRLLGRIVVEDHVDHHVPSGAGTSVHDMSAVSKTAQGRPGCRARARPGSERSPGAGDAAGCGRRRCRRGR